MRGCWGQGTEGDSTFGSLGQPLGRAVNSSSCVGRRESCTAEAGCAGWSLPRWASFHPNNPNNPPLCLRLLLHSASGAGWKSCLCPLLCPAAEWPARCPGASLEWDIAKGMRCRLSGEQEVSCELLLPFLGENWLGCPGSRAGTGWDSVSWGWPRCPSRGSPLAMLVLGLEPTQPPGLAFWCSKAEQRPGAPRLAGTGPQECLGMSTRS